MDVAASCFTRSALGEGALWNSRNASGTVFWCLFDMISVFVVISHSAIVVGSFNMGSSGVWKKVASETPLERP